MEIKEALITVAQKLGIDNPEILQKLQSIEGEIEDEDGTFEQGIQELIHIDEVLAENPKNEKLKGLRARIKAESFGGFENMVLGPELSSLTDAQKAEYQRKKNATEKTKYLFRILKENGASNSDISELQNKIEEFNEKLESGELVNKSEVQTWVEKYNRLQSENYLVGIESKIKPSLIDSIANDKDSRDLLETKLSKLMKQKGIEKDFETGLYKKGDTVFKKPNKPSQDFTDDDLIEMFKVEYPNLIKKSEPIQKTQKEYEVIDKVVAKNPFEERARERARKSQAGA